MPYSLFGTVLTMGYYLTHDFSDRAAKTFCSLYTVTETLTRLGSSTVLGCTLSTFQLNTISGVQPYQRSVLTPMPATSSDFTSLASILIAAISASSCAFRRPSPFYLRIWVLSRGAF